MLLRLTSFILAFLFSVGALHAQSDSILAPDTAGIQIDSFFKRDSISLTKTLSPAVIRFDTSVFKSHPFYKIDAPLVLISSTRKWVGKDVFFYILLILFLFFALIRNTFNRYLNDLVKLFLRTTIKDRQVKEQLMQAPLPSLLLNVLFLITGSLFLNIILFQYKLNSSFNFWFLLLICGLGLTVIYLIKFLVLKLCGWLFQLADTTNAYIFIVFTTNKIMGILLLPLIGLLIFSTGPFNEAIITFGLLLVTAMFLYRFFLSYMSLNRQLKIGFFHFVLYLCAFEVAPLLLINKLLFSFLG